MKDSAGLRFTTRKEESKSNHRYNSSEASTTFFGWTNDNLLRCQSRKEQNFVEKYTDTMREISPYTRKNQLNYCLLRKDPMSHVNNLKFDIMSKKGKPIKVQLNTIWLTSKNEEFELRPNILNNMILKQRNNSSNTSNRISTSPQLGNNTKHHSRNNSVSHTDRSTSRSNYKKPFLENKYLITEKAFDDLCSEKTYHSPKKNLFIKESESATFRGNSSNKIKIKYQLFDSPKHRMQDNFETTMKNNFKKRTVNYSSNNLLMKMKRNSSKTSSDFYRTAITSSNTVSSSSLYNPVNGY